MVVELSSADVTRNRGKNRDFKILPATLADMVELAEAVGATRAQWGVIRQVFAESEAWSIWQGEHLLGTAGLVPIGPDQAETWFHFRPGAAGAMILIVRAIRLTLARAPYRAIVTLCTSEAGARICRAAGFHFAERTDNGEVWAYARNSGHGRGGQEAPNAGAAADQPGAAGTAAGRTGPGRKL